ncbi:unnamed protein product [Rodentolepis nana]|uniref:TORC_N domain-containing protein n=1 Tax=Rodentolepis nana TaxID=102285 RepID=A0A0R3TLW5_RODNA|nr:unnamed protein product [Rodentolepis nana]
MTGKPHNNTNPRKFKEKIELLRQKEAQLTANFMEVMRGIPTLTRNVVTYSDLANKDLSPTGNMSPSPRISLDAAKPAGGYTRGMDKSDSYQYALEAASGTTNRSHYGNSGGLDSGGGGERVSISNQISGTDESTADTHTQGRNRETSKARNWSRNQSSADSGDSGLVSQISPLRGPQNSLSPSVSYQPNLASISVSPHSPSPSSLPPTSSSSLPVPPTASQFYPSAEPSPSTNQRQQFHPPAAPPPVQPTHSANRHTIIADYGWGDSGNPVDGESGAIPSGMSLMDYRRTYSDSCIPSSFAEPNRRFQQQSGVLQYHQQLVQNQGPPYPPPPLQPQPVQTLPPVNEFTFSRYQNTNNPAGTSAISSNAASITVGGSYFNGTGSSLSPRCRHQSSITVSHQHQQNPSWRKLQPDYHSMRNIPQRYAPLHHHHHNHHHQMMPITPQQQSHQQQQQLSTSEAMSMEGYESYGSGQNGVWGVNGNGNGYSASVRDLPSSMNTSRLRR